VKFGRVRGGGY